MKFFRQLSNDALNEDPALDRVKVDLHDMTGFIHKASLVQLWQDLSGEPYIGGRFIGDNGDSLLCLIRRGDQQWLTKP